jgi:Cu+-exporting ATPase
MLYVFIITQFLEFGIGRRFYVNAYKALKHGGANMDVLIVIGTSAAYFYSVLAIALRVVTSEEGTTLHSLNEGN